MLNKIERFNFKQFLNQLLNFFYLIKIKNLIIFIQKIKSEI